MSLKNDLQAIHGVGENKASEIIEVVEAHGGSELSDEDLENLRNGIDYVENGQPGYAMKFFDRVQL